MSKRRIHLFPSFVMQFSVWAMSSVFAGGLSGDVAYQAICEDILNQCMTKVKKDIPCKNISESACRDKRYTAEKQCNFLFSHCMQDEPPVKSIKPVFEGKKKY